jgi:hypothetical protein
MIPRVLTVFFLIPFSASAAVTYSESPDDFSNGTVFTVKVTTQINGPATLFISCYPEHKLDVQLAISGTMFPDSVTEGGMLVSTTHKFDKAKVATTSDWFMNIMKYENSWYQGDKAAFIASAISSEALNIRLNKRNDIYKFGLKGAAAKLQVILSKCGEKQN